MYQEHVCAKYSPSFVICLKMLIRINLTGNPGTVGFLLGFHTETIQKELIYLAGVTVPLQQESF